MIQKRNIRSALQMCLQQRVKILPEYHITGGNYHIWLRHSLNNLDVFLKCVNIRIVQVVLPGRIGKQHLHLAVLGVNVIVAPGSHVFYQRARIVIADINMNPVNITVTHVGNRKIYDPVPSENRKRTDRTVFFHFFYTS